METQRERRKIDTLIAEIGKGKADASDIEQLIDAARLAVLDEAEKGANEYLTQGIGSGVWEAAVPVNIITQLKQRYGGKEQE